VTSFLLLDIRETEATAELLNEEGAFTRLLDLISDPKQNADASLHRMLMELLYEMSRIQRIKPDELGASTLHFASDWARECHWKLTMLIVLIVHVDDAFICQLFKLIEQLSDDVNDPYHYPIIRVLVGIS
jgi:hypothetical protein